MSVVFLIIAAFLIAFWVFALVRRLFGFVIRIVLLLVIIGVVFLWLASS
jgi:hypothetical protein